MKPTGEIVVYRSSDGQSTVQLRAVGGTVWLTQAQMAELYQTSAPNIAQIIGRVLSDGEVSDATINSELMVRPGGAQQSCVSPFGRRGRGETASGFVGDDYLECRFVTPVAAGDLQPEGVVDAVPDVDPR